MKQEVEIVKRTAEQIGASGDVLKKQAAPLKDAELNRKIDKITEDCKEVVQHIKQRTDKSTG